MIFGHQDIFEELTLNLKLKLLESGADARALKMMKKSLKFYQADPREAVQTNFFNSTSKSQKIILK